MTSLVLAERVVEDLLRIHGHLLEHEAGDVEARLASIYRGLDALVDNPLIGRPCRGRLRELVIGRDSRGYLALYDYDPLLDTVHVWAIRAQREAGYATTIP
ncbi:type II toxin-antitoxin system RelE/ParE family toxin [Lysobacter maris]|uniref:Type II toxin-antitoxin system RelE/ParE family toxin n=1 Tax=Marilutibacter maris TaxID=1605891 RepID=A0A508A647_9GAMM|nr:type II toxin-antitoxin system RelE/ParE family toxin [Lysobacter maris]KAB8172609.1 type II toxin-antitoxin system RelE/ParE family toxin [Lysobacter maris]